MTRRTGQLAKPFGHAELVGAILASIGLDIEDRRAIKKIQPAHNDPPSIASHNAHERQADGIWPRRRIERKNAELRQVLEFKSTAEQGSWLHFQWTTLFPP